MYHSVIKKYRYHIRRNVYQLYKIRRHGMAMHPGALDIDDVARARPAPGCGWGKGGWQVASKMDARTAGD
eukprot:COSAG01_NODE_53616_length_338_cov_0.414226_1_plen_70_part_00